jgi:hypothetical protein
VFPQSQDDTGECTSTSESPETAPVNSNEEKEIQAQPAPSVGSGDTIWVEGLVPGIDFCNHGMPIFVSKRLYYQFLRSIMLIWLMSISQCDVI